MASPKASHSSRQEIEYLSTTLWKAYPIIPPSFSLTCFVRFPLMCVSADLKTDWEQLPALVTCVLDYTQFYWETVSEFGDYTGLVLVLCLFLFPDTISNTMTCHTEEQCFLQLNPIQKLLTQNFCQPQWDEKEEILTIGQIHYYLKPILHVSLNINTSTQRGKYNRSWLPACSYWQGHTASIGILPGYRPWKMYTARYTLCNILLTWDNCYTSLGIWVLWLWKMYLKLPAALTNLSFQEKKKL